MKTKLILYSTVFILLLFNVSNSQIITFDSLEVLLSSTQYDYKNPKFFSTYVYVNQYAILVYEKWDSLTSNIAVRKVYFDSLGPEVMITNNTSGQNINQSFSKNFLFWQSNISGNWDIYYSDCTSGNWSVPILLAGSNDDETEPCIYNNNTGPGQYNFYFLAFKRNYDIIFKAYRTLTATWYPDTNVTTNIPYNCTKPLIIKGSTAPSYDLCFSMNINDTLKRIFIKRFYENFTIWNVTWDPGSELYQPKSQDNLHNFLGDGVFEYDTLGSVHTIDFYKNVFTYQLTGRNLNADAQIYGSITDNPDWWYITAFACLNKRNDSSSIKVTKNITDLNYYNVWKSFYLGDTSVNSKITVSPGLSSYTMNLFRINVVWEQMFNGKTALYQTYMTEILGGIQGSGKELNYVLHQNYPNPFNPVTNIRFDLNQTSHVKLVVYDVLGKEIITLTNKKLSAGSYLVEWDGSDYPSGVYFYRIEINSDKFQTNEFVDTRKMMLIK